MVLVAWVLMLGAGQFLLFRHLGCFAVYALALVIGLIGICYWKGEKPCWRWGKD